MIAAEYVSNGLLLSTLLEGISALGQESDRTISGLALDSRAVAQGDLFLACAGHQQHGIDYAAAAVEAGAVALLWEPTDEVGAERVAALGIPAVAVEGLAQQLGEIAARFFGHPSRELFMIGITGTNGKTSSAQFLATALDSDAAPCGVIGTLGNGRVGALEASSHTTPDAVSLQALLAEMRDSGMRRVVMEVSSHALVQGRVNAIEFDLALWTNLSREHLDYHGDMASYAAAKQQLFAMPGLHHAVINADDAAGRELIEKLTELEPVRYGFSEAAGEGTHYVRGHDLLLSEEGMRFKLDSSWGSGELQSPLLGRFNAGNLLGAAASLLAMGEPLVSVLQRLAAVTIVAGRMERLGGDEQALVVIDYAHTPDALEQVLKALRDHCQGRLWLVFGCGGDRDRGKRAEMGAIAEEFADYIVVTDDNPRHEDPLQIIIEILNGMSNPDSAYLKRSRREAISFAMYHAAAGDVVLIAGKGHENYQQFGSERRPFSDRAEVERLLSGGSE